MKSAAKAVVIPFPKPFFRPLAQQARVVRHNVAVSLLQPSFERQGRSLLSLWWARWRWRSALLSDLAGQPDSVLADFGVTHATLLDYARRPFWRA